MRAKNVNIVWFRQDLRVKDQPALSHACKDGSVLPLYLYEDDSKHWTRGAASRSWLHRSLASLANDLDEKGLTLIIRQGDPLKELLTVCKQVQATQVFVNACYEPLARKRDVAIAETLKDHGIAFKVFHGSLLRAPHATLNQSGKPYQVFTPYWRARLKQGHDLHEISLPKQITGVSAPSIKSLELKSLMLLPKIPWDQTFYDVWTPGETGAHQALNRFAKVAADYDSERNRPDHIGTSRLSPHLHFGEISPRQVWNYLHRRVREKKKLAPYLRQLGWREFSYHLLYHFPETPDAPLKKNYAKLKWSYSKKAYAAWTRGLTGYPIVDAGMRELWQTGWMHNRVRLIVASFLIKDLMIDWRDGAKWFWDTLVDADLANNTMGWQWTAGCGADASPWYRIFNPTMQGEKFDPQGDYVRTWVPELSMLPEKFIHKPWKATAAELRAFDIVLGNTYPKRIVEHEKARNVALRAFKKLPKA